MYKKNRTTEWNKKRGIWKRVKMFSKTKAKNGFQDSRNV